MNLKEQQDKEYRAQWIRDSARELLVARLVCSTPMAPAVTRESLVDDMVWAANRLWDRYEQERK